MTYQSLYRRYRPRRFGEVVGQQHVVVALRNAVREERTGHAYLFSGPRGTGKTSIARILAKALNCTDLQDGEPCGRCESCLSIDNGTSYDLHELDAASNNGVEAMRDLINKAAIGSPGRSKVYILDEVHMLSTAASNALLKTLEEPPPHVAFVLATTDPQHVLPTIRSRCQHLEFFLISAADLEAHVRHVAADAGIVLDDEAVAYVVRKGAGSARDTLSVLEQVAALGSIPADGEPLDDLVAALVERSSAQALASVAHLTGNGREPRLIGEQLLARLRDAFLLTMGASAPLLPDGELDRVVAMGRALGPAGLTRALEALGEALVEMRQAPDARVPLEVALIRLTRPELDTNVAALVERIAQLEQQVAGLLAGAPRTAPPGGDGDGFSTAAATTSSASAPMPDAGGHGDGAERGPTTGPPPPTAAPPAAPAGAAAEARRRLQQRNSGPPAGRPAPLRNAGSTDPALPAAGPAAAAATAAGPAASAAAERIPAPATAAGPAERSAAVGGASAELPPLEELTRGWTEAVLDSLAPAAKARYRAGRFLALDGPVAVYGLPNAIHRDRCEEKRPDVEAALGRHFGRPIPLRLVVDDAADALSAAGGAPPPFEPTPGPEGPGRTSDAPRGVSARPSVSTAGNRAGREPDGVDDDIDVDDLHALPDATDVASTITDLVMQAFPGAQVVE